MSKLVRVALAIASAFGVALGGAQAGVIIAPTDGTASSEFMGCCAIDRTFDQSGLSAGYTNGVTDFDTYLASNPTHTLVAIDFEWFTEQGVTSATVDYDLGADFTIDAMALWNEEASGIGETSLYGSLNGTDFFLLTIFTPFDNPASFDYAAEVIDFAATLLRYVRLEITGCPQPSGENFIACAIGEVAFRVADGVSDVPIPGAIPLFLAGLAGLGWAKRRRTA